MRGASPTRSPALLVSWTVLCIGGACATERPLAKGPTLRVADALELFRRARFSDVEDGDPDRVAIVAGAVGVSRRSPVDQLGELDARAAYLRGDGRAARELAALLPRDNPVRRSLEELLAHVGLDRPLRSSHVSKRSVELPLDAVALDRGYPILNARVNERTVRLLWDTGASENILSPEITDALQLDWSRSQVSLRRPGGALVVRFGATGTPEVQLGAWKVENMPWLVSELETNESLKRDLQDIDGFLSPQLLVPTGCFAIDRLRATLTVGFDAAICHDLMAEASLRAPLYAWNGEVYTVAHVANSPHLGVQLETGSAVSFLRTQAARWLPQGSIREDPSGREGEIAHALHGRVTLEAVGRARLVSAIDLAPNRDARAHDDIATLGNDVLLQGRGVVVSFAAREVGTLELAGAPHLVAAAPEKSGGR